HHRDTLGVRAHERVVADDLSGERTHRDAPEHPRRAPEPGQPAERDRDDAREHLGAVEESRRVGHRNQAQQAVSHGRHAWAWTLVPTLRSPAAAPPGLATLHDAYGAR